jgi:hypothetical protein
MLLMLVLAVMVVVIVAVAVTLAVVVKVELQQKEGKFQSVQLQHVICLFFKLTRRNHVARSAFDDQKTRQTLRAEYEEQPKHPRKAAKEPQNRFSSNWTLCCSCVPCPASSRLDQLRRDLLQESSLVSVPLDASRRGRLLTLRCELRASRT